MEYKSGWMEEPSKKEFSLEPQESFKRWRYGTGLWFITLTLIACLPPPTKIQEEEEEEREVNCCCRNAAFERKEKIIMQFNLKTNHLSFVFPFY